MKTYLRLMMCAVLMLSFVGVMPGVVGVARGEEIIAEVTAYRHLELAEGEIVALQFEGDATLAAERDAAKDDLIIILDRRKFSGHWDELSGDRLIREKSSMPLEMLGRVITRLDAMIQRVPSSLGGEDPRIRALQGVMGHVHEAMERIAAEKGKTRGPRFPEKWSQSFAAHFAKGEQLFLEKKFPDSFLEYRNAYKVVAIHETVRDMLRGLEQEIIARPLGGVEEIEGIFRGIGIKIAGIVHDENWQGPDEIVADSAKRAKISRDLAEMIEDAMVINEHPDLKPEDRIYAEFIIDVVLRATARHVDHAIIRAKAAGVPAAKIDKAQLQIRLGDDKFNGSDRVGSYRHYTLAGRMLEL